MGEPFHFPDIRHFRCVDCTDRACVYSQKLPGCSYDCCERHSKICSDHSRKDHFICYTPPRQGESNEGCTVDIELFGPLQSFLFLCATCKKRPAKFPYNSKPFCCDACAATHSSKCDEPHGDHWILSPDVVKYTKEHASAISDIPIDEKPVTRSNDITDESHECVICMEGEKDHAVSPCGHICLCKECSINPSITLCPVCRGPKTSTMKIFHV